MDFKNIFGKALKYPRNSNIYFFLLLVNVIVFLARIPVSEYETQVALGLQPANPMFYILSLGFAIANLIISVFIIGFYLHNSHGYYTKKKYGNLADSVSPSKKGFFHLLGSLIIIIALAVMAFFIFGGFSAFIYLPETISILLLITGIIAACIIVYLFFLAPAYATIETKNAASALVSSYHTVKKNKISTLIFLVLAILIAVAINFVGAVPIISYSLIVGPYAISSLGQGPLMLFSFFQLLFTTYATLFLYSSLSNFYSEVRGIKTKEEEKKVVRKAAIKRKAPARRKKK